MNSHTFTRQELYDLVWSEPTVMLATRYGISGNGLAKACRKAEIPGAGARATCLSALILADPVTKVSLRFWAPTNSH